MGKDRFDLTVDHEAVTKPSEVRRLEIITGPERRRRWSREEKLKIVAESYRPGVVVSEVARRHGLRPQQLFGWRNQLRKMMPTSASANEPPLFVPVIAEEASPAGSPPADRQASPGRIEIAIGAFTVRVLGAVDGKALKQVLRAVMAVSDRGTGKP